MLQIIRLKIEQASTQHGIKGKNELGGKTKASKYKQCRLTALFNQGWSAFTCSSAAH